VDVTHSRLNPLLIDHIIRVKRLRQPVIIDHAQPKGKIGSKGVLVHPSQVELDRIFPHQWDIQRWNKIIHAKTKKRRCSTRNSGVGRADHKEIRIGFRFTFGVIRHGRDG
jgi:hypothetical protein